MILWLPLPPNRANARYGHWGEEHGERVRYFTELSHRVRAGVLAKAPAVKPDRARLEATFFRRSGAAMDPDNAIARLKWPIDWLVRNGYLAGDEARHLTLLPARQVIGYGEVMASLRIELTEIMP